MKILKTQICLCLCLINRNYVISKMQYGKCQLFYVFKPVSETGKGSYIFLQGTSKNKDSILHMIIIMK